MIHGRRWMFLLCASLMVTMAIGGCAQSPQQQLATSQGLYLSTVRSVSDSYRAGLITHQDALAFERYRQAARNGLDAWMLCLEEGREDDVIQAITRSALNSMIAIRNQIKAGGQ